MEPRKQAICDVLRTWISQRPGFDPANYDRAGYLSDSRMVQRQLHDARELLRAVELSGITADALAAAFPRAYSGRLTITEERRNPCRKTHGPERPASGCSTCVIKAACPLFEIDYCTGQYWCTEYRAAACAVLASALWEFTREECMPPVHGYRVESWSQLGKERTLHTVVINREAAELQLENLGGSDYGAVCELYRTGKDYMSGGEWLRAHFRQQFGRGIASRWFS